MVTTTSFCQDKQISTIGRSIQNHANKITVYRMWLKINYVETIDSLHVIDNTDDFGPFKKKNWRRLWNRAHLLDSMLPHFRTRDISFLSCQRLTDTLTHENNLNDKHSGVKRIIYLSSLTVFKVHRHWNGYWRMAVKMYALQMQYIKSCHNLGVAIA
jgi:hypothetical protein